MGQTRRRYSREFKVEAVRQLHDGRRQADEARELGVNATVIRRWKDQVAVDAATAFPGNGRRRDLEDEVRRLRWEVEQLRAERDFLKKTAVESTGRCNTLYSSPDSEGVVHGTDGTSRSFCDTESRIMATVETR